MLRVAVPDLVSPSYFPAIAAVDLGLLAEEGVEAELELRFPVTAAATALRDGEVDVLACSAHAPLHAFPGWLNAHLVMALSHGTYWFLVVRADLGIARGDLHALRSLRLGAAPGPDLGLHALLDAAGVDPDAQELRIAPPPHAPDGGTSFGVNAARALADGAIDGFWANGMGAEVAVRDGIGSIVVDARRGDGPAGSDAFTFPAAAVASATFASRSGEVEAFVRATARAQRILRADPGTATAVGRRRFPPREAELIAELVRRDAPSYRPEIVLAQLDALHRFAHAGGLDVGQARFDDVVPPAVTAWWQPTDQT